MQELKKIMEEIIEQLKEEGCIIDDAAGNRAEEIIRGIIRKHMDDGWIPVEERLPEEGERCAYDDEGTKYMKRLEIAYMTDTVEYIHGYYDGYKWMDKWHDIIENVIAWKIHEPYRPERSNDAKE